MTSPQPIQVRYTPMSEWPPLAWLARCPRGGAAVDVAHGRRVETGDDRFCEAIWDGPYESGDFDRTDAVFGSGGRRRDGDIVFVSSGTTIDRLHSIETDDGLFVSNSLVCLLATLGGTVDPTYPDYYVDFRSIIRGINDYTRAIATSVGPVQLTYYRNLRWDGAQLVVENKPTPVRDFSSFASYRAFLDDLLRGLSANMASAAREYPYEMLGTLSSGYDSATLVALARHFGLRDVISFDQARGGGSDNGEEIAEILGVRLTLVSRDAWRAQPLAEVPFVAADAKGEDVLFAGAEAQLAGKAVLLGHLGGLVWAKKLKADGGAMARTDQSGLSLAEYRLWAGFIHCAIPFVGYRQADDVCAITNSPEMAGWDVPGDYSRPICRRIIEEAGVPRGMFGVRKKAASVLLFEQHSFLSPESEADYRQWLSAHAGEWRSQRRLPPVARGGLRDPVQGARRVSARALYEMAGLAPRRLWPLRAIAGKLGTRDPMFRSLFPWALERAMQRYGSPRAVARGSLAQVGR